MYKIFLRKRALLKKYENIQILELKYLIFFKMYGHNYYIIKCEKIIQMFVEYLAIHFKKIQITVTVIKRE